MRETVTKVPKTYPTFMALVAALAALVASLVAAGCGGDEEMPPPVVEPVAPPAEAAGADAPKASEPPQPRPQEAPRVGATPEAQRERGNPVVWVRRGEKVDLYDRPGGKVMKRVGWETEFGSRTVFAVDHSHGRWAAVPTPYFENGRLAWIRLDPRRLGSGQVGWEIEVDLSDYQATLLLNERRVRTFGVSIGMPGAETPTGHFAVTDTFRGNLNPAYGCCAVALTARQTRLPSGWLGGDRIAIHGTSGPLGAAISHGCVRAPNDAVSELVDKVPPGTPVVIRQ